MLMTSWLNNDNRKNETVTRAHYRVAGAQHPKDAVQDAPVVNPGNATRLVGKHRVDNIPLMVAEMPSCDRLGRHHGSGNLYITRATRSSAADFCFGFTVCMAGVHDTQCGSRALFFV